MMLPPLVMPMMKFIIPFRLSGFSALWVLSLGCVLALCGCTSLSDG
jgi:hypothetical protein